MSATRLSATSREPEEWAKATELARVSRRAVADQLRELVIEGDRMGGRGEVAIRVQRIVEAEGRIAGALAAQAQAREDGAPLQPLREAEAEARDALRSAAMGLAVASASWVAAIDHDAAVRASGSGATV